MVLLRIRCRVELRLRAAAVTHPNALAEHFGDPQRQSDAVALAVAISVCDANLQLECILACGKRSGRIF